MDNFDIDDDWEDFQAWIGGVNCVSVALAGGNAIERTLTAAEPFEAGQVAMMVPRRCALIERTGRRGARLSHVPRVHVMSSVSVCLCV